MDQQVKKYAESLYQRSLMESARTLNTDRVRAASEMAARRGNSNLPMGGSEFQLIINLYIGHIDRCMQAKLQSYQTAFDEAQESPSAQDLSQILTEVKDAQTLQIQHAAHSLNDFMRARGSTGDITDSITAASGHGHDRVLEEWKVWRERVNLKLIRGQKQFSDQFPSNLRDVQEDIDYWAARQHEGSPGSNFDLQVRARLDHLRHLHDRFSKIEQSGEPTRTLLISGSSQPKAANGSSPNTPKESWDVFISHASEDKQTLVEKLALALAERGLRVWYDQFELTVGDSLRQSIDYGLANSDFGIVILSPHFFAKHWPQQELNGLAAREEHGVKVILPVWHNIDRHGVAQFSPMLADRLATRSSDGISAIVEDLLRAIYAGQNRATSSRSASEQIRRQHSTASDVRSSAFMRKPTIVAALITAAALVLAALIGLYPSMRHEKAASSTTSTTSIAGVVVEQDTNRAVGQATIVVTGRAEQYVTEDSGNFKILLRGDVPARLRLRVTKTGFQPLDTSVEPPIEDLVLQLRRK